MLNGTNMTIPTVSLMFFSMKLEFFFLPKEVENL